MYDNNLFVYLFSDTSPTDIYTLSLHDALPISSIARATGYLNEGKLALAAAEAREALESGEDRAEAANLLGIISDRQGNSADAEKNFREALKASPNAAVYRHNLGNALMQQKKQPAAIAEFEKALQI